MNTIYTTGQIAKICKVAPRTVSKWFDSGRLRGYRIPGSQDRRIPREHLINFLKEHGMPLGELEQESIGRILNVGVSDELREAVGAHLNSDEFRCESVESAFDAGTQSRAIKPDCFVIDFEMGRNEAIAIADHVTKSAEHSDVVVIGLLTGEEKDAGIELNQFTETFHRPFDAALVAERIRALVSRKWQPA